MVCKLSSPCGTIRLYTIMNEDSVGLKVFNLSGKHHNLPVTLAGKFLKFCSGLSVNILHVSRLGAPGQEVPPEAPETYKPALVGG